MSLLHNEQEQNNQHNKVDLCLRCGECCHYPDATGKLKKCKFLIKIGKDKYFCRIYKDPTRVGHIIGHGLKDGEIVPYQCGLRENRHENIGNCPYNREEWK